MDGLNVVHDLIDNETKEWNVECLERNFGERDKTRILSIPLSSRAVKD